MLGGIKAVMISLFAGLCDRLLGLIGGKGVGAAGLIMRGSESSIQRRRTGQLVGALDNIAYPRAPDESLHNIVELFLANSFSVWLSVLV